MSKQSCKIVRRALGLNVNRVFLPSYSWPGGYQMYYLFADGGTCCADCVNTNIDRIRHAIKSDRKSDEQWKLVGCEVNWEDEHMYCVNCNERIPASYE